MSDTFIFGIGNEVLVTFLIYFSILIVFVYLVLGNGLRHLEQIGFRGLSNPFSGVNARNSNQQFAQEAMMDPIRTYNSDRCPICLIEHTLPLETNCGHIFCGSCLREYFNRSHFLARIMTCPLCRQQISMLFICFTQDELACNEPNIVEMRNDLQSLVHQYNRNYSGQPRSLLDYIRDWPTLMRHLCNEFFSVGGIMVMFRIRIIMCFLAGLVYLLSPLDFIPEAMFGLLGFLDDLFVVFLLAIYVSILYRRLVVSRTIGQVE